MADRYGHDLATVRSAKERHLMRLLAYPNVIGCGVAHRFVRGRRKRELCVRVYVERKLRKDWLRPEEIVPRELEAGENKVPTDIVPSPLPVLVSLTPDESQYRPIIGGTQTTEGTIGAIVIDRLMNDHVMLTNNHCFTRPFARNQVQPGEFFMNQPFSYPLAVGQFRRLVPMALMPFNVGFNFIAPVDAAIGQFRPGFDGDFKIADIGDSPYFVNWPELGMQVTKRGWRTRATHGYVTATDISMIFDGHGDRLLITRVFAIHQNENEYWETQAVGWPYVHFQQVRSPFALGGDSGSLVVEGISTGVGLLFGSDLDAQGFACDLPVVFNMLDLETPCSGALRKTLKFAHSGSGVPWEQASDNIDRFRAKYLNGETMGGALAEALQILSIQLTRSVYDDDDFFGLSVDALAPLMRCATVHQILNGKLDAAFVDNVGRVVDRFSRQVPDVAAPAHALVAMLRSLEGETLREVVDTPIPRRLLTELRRVLHRAGARSAAD